MHAVGFSAKLLMSKKRQNPFSHTPCTSSPLTDTKMVVVVVVVMAALRLSHKVGGGDCGGNGG